MDTNWRTVDDLIEKVSFSHESTGFIYLLLFSLLFCRNLPSTYFWVIHINVCKRYRSKGMIGW